MPSRVIPQEDSLLRSRPMENPDCPVLRQCLDRDDNDPSLHSLQQRLDQFTARPDTSAHFKDFINIYDEAIPLVESQLWSEGINTDKLGRYQQLFREMEGYISGEQDDRRYEFIVVIPVADRPQHLSTCLASLLQLCKLFQYGGHNGQYYSKVSVLVADDSKQPDNMAQHREMTSRFSQQGLKSEYFGLQEQLKIIDQLTAEQRQQLSTVIGDIEPDVFYHKGASIMRNITYLRLNQLCKDNDRLLAYFIDSDQEFKLKLSDGSGDRDVCAINFFYYLDQIFTNTDADILTGKVVGDPPVSPAVMASNFLDDVIGFLTSMAGLDATQACQFHGHHQQHKDNAAYHDMADMFGFKTEASTYEYQCTLSGTHKHEHCFDDFAAKLNRFFDGEHPTRKIDYEYADMRSSVAPARTVYTGNYVFKPEMLKYFIPFATLKLRMAGPVLGRLIKADIGKQFVSANIPMWHKRTVDEIGQSEFRPGIERDVHRVDLSGEFERQFFGDVMLFTMEQLTELGYPAEALAEEQLDTILLAVEEKLLQQYTAKHEQIMQKLAALKTIFTNDKHWWNSTTTPRQALLNINQFIENMATNFGDESTAYALIHSNTHRATHRARIRHAIMTYAVNRLVWAKTLAGS